MPDYLKEFFDSMPIRFALIAFCVGVAWADLHAQIRENKLEVDARFAIVASDVHALKVLACRAYPHDSVCTP